MTSVELQSVGYTHLPHLILLLEHEVEEGICLHVGAGAGQAFLLCKIIAVHCPIAVMAGVAGGLITRLIQRQIDFA